MAKSFSDVFDAIEPDAVPPVRPAKEVLVDLAKTLNRRARYKTRFDVETLANDNRVIHTLTAVVPALDNYMLQLLRASHEALKLYPVSLAGLLIQAQCDVDDEDELFEALATVVKSKQFGDVFATLMAQA